MTAQEGGTAFPPASSLKDWLQKDDGDHNYFVVVPFTTAQGALWGAGHIEPMFDCQVIGGAAIDLDTPLIEGPLDA